MIEPEMAFADLGDYMDNAEAMIKFVIQMVLERAWEITREYDLTHHTHVYLSPVFGAIQPADMVEFMKDHHMTGVTLQIQLHKVIWDPNKQGV